jgi:xyloglucan-specific endo-beta-1,4-glucanase
LNVSDDARSFSIGYKWLGDASTVKGFPYMKVWPSRLPVQLWNISALEFSAQWRIYVEGTQDQSPEEQAVAMDQTALYTNAAIDMFLSDDATNSTGLGSPIEIMIWPWYTPTVLPLGHAESTPDIDNIEIAGTNYSLYHGWNQQGQHVFSWLAHQNITSVDADFGPLLKYIWEKGLLSGALYVGQLEFGTEVMHAGEETVFEARHYTLKIIRDGDPDAPKTSTTSSATAGPTATRTSPATQAATTTEGSSATSSAASPMLLHQGDGLFISIGAWAVIGLLTVSMMSVDIII